MFNTNFYRKSWKTSFSLTESSWKKSATVITERPAHIFSEIIINIFPNFESIISVHKLLDTTYSSFPKAALDLSFQPNNLFQVKFQDQNEW